MKRLTSLALAVLAAVGLACGPREAPLERSAEPSPADAGGEQRLAAAAYPTVPLTEPWSTLALPTDSGHVVVSSATTVSVAHDGSTVAALFEAYGTAVAAAGWSVLGQESAGDHATAIYEREGRRMALGLGERDGVVLVILEDRSAVEANNAKVRDAKPAEPAPDGPDAFRRRRASSKAGKGKRSRTLESPRRRGKRNGKKARR